MALYPNEMLTPHFITGVAEERPNKESIKGRYLWPRFFPLKEVPERRLTWDSIMAENNLAGVYGTKGEPIPGDDILFRTYWANLLDVMAARHLDHDIINSVRSPGMAAVYRTGGAANPIKGLRQRFENHIKQNVAWCDDAIEGTMEYFAINALWGSIVWPPVSATGAVITPAMPHWNAKMAVSFSFGMPSIFAQNASALVGHGGVAATQVAWTWANRATANPIVDLEVIAQYMVEQKGVNADDMLILMSRSTLSNIAFMTNVLQWIRGKQYEADGLGNYVEINRIKEFIQSRLGYKIETYDAQWTYYTDPAAIPPTIQRVKFLREGRVIIIPTAELSGDNWYMATAPHKDGAGNFKSGKYSWIHEDDEPPMATRMGLGIVAWPIMESGSDCVFRLSAYS